MLDPLYLRVLALGFALMFALAGLHKLSDKTQFLGVLAAYEILPSFLLSPATLVIPALEMLLAFAWLALGIGFLSIPAVGVVSASLLCVYAVAIGINLYRGRRDIDCGCGLSSAKHTSSVLQAENQQQTISGLLLWRNGTLALLALSPLAAAAPRQLNVLDLLTVIGALFSIVLLYASMNQLIATSQLIKSWRGHLGKLAND